MTRSSAVRAYKNSSREFLAAKRTMDLGTLKRHLKNRDPGSVLREFDAFKRGIEDRLITIEDQLTGHQNPSDSSMERINIAFAKYAPPKKIAATGGMNIE